MAHSGRTLQTWRLMKNITTQSTTRSFGSCPAGIGNPTSGAIGSRRIPAPCHPAKQPKKTASSTSAPELGRPQ
eukprot:16364151-Heterocapsa_arctica.AAC.1